MDVVIQSHLARLAAQRDSGAGRSIPELVKTNDTLKGVESQRLRTYFSSQYMEPSRDLDSYGKMLFVGDLKCVQDDFEARIKKHNRGQPVNLIARDSEEYQKLRNAAAMELYELRWGQTLVPIFDLLLLATLICPERRYAYLNITRWLCTSAKVPVDATDLSGTTALSHSISTKPAVDLEFAQIMYTAGGDVNQRNRYGGTSAHEICQVYPGSDATKLKRAEDMLRWFLSHGGNVDIKDGDGCVARKAAATVAKIGMKSLLEMIESEDKRRKANWQTCCTFCGRDDAEKLLKCGRCKKARYCEPTTRTCQKMDWGRHKAECKA